MTDALATGPAERPAASADDRLPAVPVWPMYRALVGVGVLCGALIVTAYEVTRPIIARNQAEALERAVFQVLPGARSTAPFRWTGGGFAPALGAAAGDEPTVVAAYGADGALVGVAVEGRAMGYADTIRMLWGWDPAQEAIVGTKVLETRETPGLGDAIEKDAAFLRNFERLDVRLAPDGDRLANALVAVKPGEKANPWEVDTVTGATISSTAVVTLLAEGAGRWVPRLTRHLDDLRRGPEAP